jgi:hypothetical protein
MNPTNINSLDLAEVRAADDDKVRWTRGCRCHLYTFSETSKPLGIKRAEAPKTAPAYSLRNTLFYSSNWATRK